MHDYAEQLPPGWGSERLKFNTYIKGRIGWQGLRAEEFMDEGPYCVTGTDFSLGKVDWVTCYRITSKRFSEDTAIHLNDGDLLVTKDGTIGKLAIVNSLPGPATLNSGVFVTRPLKDAYNPKFLYWVLASPDFRTFVELQSNGTTINHLFQNVFENFSTPLPCRADQERIANFLDDKTARIDALIAEKERLKQLLEDHWQAKLCESLHTAACLERSPTPKGWTQTLLKRVCHSIQTGRTPSGARDDCFAEGGHPWITPGDLRDGLFASTSARTVTKLAFDDGEVVEYPAAVLLSK